MLRAGQIEEVGPYCETDVVNTYRVWLVYDQFRGAITAKELDWSEAQICEFVASRKTANPHLSAAVGIFRAIVFNVRTSDDVHDRRFEFLGI